jgi:phage minor structural protein
MNPLYHFDNLDNQLGTIFCPLEVLYSWELNSTHSLELQSLTMLEKEDRVLFQDGLGKWREFIVMESTDDDSDGRVIYSASLTDSIEELSGDYIVEKEPTGNASYVLGVALENSRWEVGTVDVVGSNRMSWYHTNALAAIYDICDVFGCELSATITVSGSKVTRRQINLHTRLGSDKGKRFTYRRGLKSIKRTREAGKVYTRLYGYGKGLAITDDNGEETGGFSRKITFGDVNGGLDYIETKDQSVLKRWGRPDGKGGYAHTTGKVEFDDCEDQTELLQLTREYFNNQLDPQMSYEASVIDLKEAGFDAVGVEEGDTVTIVDEVFNPPLHLTGRVLAATVDYIRPENTTITLSNVQEVLSDRMIKEAQKTRALYDHAASWDSAASLPSAYLEAIIDRLNDEFNAGGSYKFESFELGTIYSSVPLDENGKPTGTPATAFQLTGMGFRIASAVNSSGEFVWRTFGTGSGFTADEINVGTLKGGSNTWNLSTGDLEFKQGRIHDTKDTFYIDIDSGDFRLASKTKVGTSTNNQTLTDFARAQGDAAVSAQTQESIFNKLTNNGQTQGIYLLDGRVYINGTYMQMGTITSKGGSHWNLDTGEFETIYTISSSQYSTNSSYTTYRESVLVIDMTQSTPFGIYSGTRYRYEYTNGNVTYSSVSGKTFLAGVTMNGTDAYLRAQRVGTSNTHYATTGTTEGGNPGASFVNTSGNYLDIEALHAVDSASGTTNGIGLACFNKPFLDASTYYNRIWLWPPTYNNTYMQQPSEQLYLGRNGNVYLQRSDSRGIFMSSDSITVKFSDTYYIRINSSGVQCRCGSKGFGWYNGSFSESLSWD